MIDSERPLLAVTMGDPSGIGPEVVLKALQHVEVYQRCRPLVLGDRRILERAAGWIGGPAPQYDLVDDPAAGRYASGVVTLLDLANAAPEDCPPGAISTASGRAAVDYVLRACDLAMAGAVNAVVTAPLNKEAMHRAGFAYAGHTELLAERTGAPRVSMLLVGPTLRVVHVSTHVALGEAIGRVTKERVEATIDLAQEACQALGMAAPRIAVAGLNPHAGEAGLFGDEEEREILPAVRTARARGLDVSDPQPPDTVFLRAVQGAFDIVVAMYHDQGHIALKLRSGWRAVNITAGLPLVRTSVAHGTAYDIAAKGVADPSSLIEATRLAAKLTRPLGVN